TGKVKDAGGLGLPGVSIVVVGTANGTTTDLEGMYQLTASEGILRYSYIGFLAKEIKISNQSVIDIVLLEDTKLLNEVVVVGYGTQKKKDLTTAVAIVGEKELKERPIVSAAQGLQGKAAGVQVIQPSGKPGSALSVRVRGATSVLAGNEPLYVIDGLPTTEIAGLNPSDISSMSVLKDASSSAIYGARAANGVVLITTKRGVENTPVVSFNAYFGASKLRKPIEVLDTKSYRNLMTELGISLDPTATGYTNWSNETFGTGYDQSYQFSVSGGSDKSRYFLSTGYLSSQGIMKPARFDRISVRMNLDNDIKPWLKIGTSFSVLNLKIKNTPDNAAAGRGGAIMSTLNTPPFLHIYKGQGDPDFVLTDKTWYDPNPFAPSSENPVAAMYAWDQLAVDNQLFGSMNIEGRLVKGLYLKSRVGIDITAHQLDAYMNPYRTGQGRGANGIAGSDKKNSTTWLWENTLDYKHTFAKNNITAMIGNSIQKNTTTDTYIGGSDFPGDVSVKTINAANIVSGYSNAQIWVLSSFFGRVTYDYTSKYYLTMSIREDGSSKLAHPWGTMPSFSAGWRISSESFMTGIKVVDDLKIRGGWGKNGNQEGIPNYAQYGLITYERRTPTDPLSGPSSRQYTYGNPDLKWETTAQTNLGFDLAMFNSRFILNFDAYYKKTSDLLLNVQLSNSLPISTIQTNAGAIVNKGIEFNISSVNIDKVWKWSSDFNMSFNRNKVTSLIYTNVYYFGNIYSNSENVSIVKAGLPLGSFFGYISEGVDPQTGNMTYKDVNGIGGFDPGDRTIIGCAQPKFIYGFTNNISYKQFDLNVFFQGSQGNDIFNATRIDLEGMFDSKNQSIVVLNRWKTPGQITDIPKVVGGGNIDNVHNSTRFIEDGSYLRLKSVTLSYKAIENNPKIKAIKKLSIYVTGQNLLTFTKYSG
ncbi:MAG: SusC/RagA family TonB-linked outer membrane protein, partial [Bacteroidales bacterium]